jgi:pimeloyl-ACP methyl ester carboxylesterase
MKMQLQLNGQGQPLVLVGNGLTGALGWEAHAQQLAPMRRVARAQPLSVQLGVERAPLPADYSVKMESRALAAALDDVGWTQPIDIVGWSYGGLIALDFALDRPERVRSLVLAEPDAAWALPDYGRGDPEVRKVEEYALRWADGVTEDDLAVYLDEMFGPGQSARDNPRWQVWSAHRDALRGTIAVYRHRDDLDRLRRFSKPVLLIVGEGTERYNVAIGEVVAQSLPSARVVELPGGHMAPAVARDRFIEEMEGFQRDAAR